MAILKIRKTALQIARSGRRPGPQKYKKSKARAVSPWNFLIGLSGGEGYCLSSVSSGVITTVVRLFCFNTTLLRKFWMSAEVIDFTVSS